jgi:hypothetical protein
MAGAHITLRATITPFTSAGVRISLGRRGIRRERLDGPRRRDIAADFSKLTGGSDVMTQPQLTSAIQQYMNTQSQHPDGFDPRILPLPA